MIGKQRLPRLDQGIEIIIEIGEYLLHFFQKGTPARLYGIQLSGKHRRTLLTIAFD